MSSPTTSTTWPTAAIVADAAMRSMGMSTADQHRPDVEHAASSAIDLVQRYLGNDELPDVLPSPIFDALVIVTVELYRRKDAAFGVLNTYTSADFGPVRVSTDWLKGVESLLLPFMRDHFGVG